MISEYEFSVLKKRLEKLVVNDIGATIKAFREALPSNSPILENLLNIEGQHRNNLDNTISNVVNHEDEKVATSQVRSRLITLILSLKLKDFEEQDRKVLVKTKKNCRPFLLYMLLGLVITPVLYLGFRDEEKGSWFSMPKDRTGYLLYSIPEKMQLNTETECVVRIAFDSLELLMDLRIEEVKIEQIGTSERMKVELLESGASKAFNIYNVLRDDEQFIEKENYAEWKFAVEPLMIGEHNLTLKVTVLKKIGDDYIPRNISFKREVKIITSPVSDTSLVFQGSSHTISRIRANTSRPTSLPNTSTPPDSPVSTSSKPINPCDEDAPLSTACCDKVLSTYEKHLIRGDFQAAIDMENQDVYYNNCSRKFTGFNLSIVGLKVKYLD